MEVLEGKGPLNTLRIRCDHGGARPDTCGESRVGKVGLLSVHGWVTRGYLPAKWGITNNCHLDTPDVCKDTVDHIVPSGYFSELRHLPKVPQDYLKTGRKRKECSAAGDGLQHSRGLVPRATQVLTGVPVSMLPTLSSGLAILLADATTQNETLKDEASRGMTASVPYVKENRVSLWLDLIVVRWAQRTWESSYIQFLFPSPRRALIPSPKLQFALFASPLDCGCFTEAKRCVIFNFSHQSLNVLSLNCLPLSETISPGRPKWHTMLYHTNFFT
ncbi:hypothetical protein Tco_0455136 [Tanacetum coccineum]